MCLAAIAWQTHPRYRLVLAANRDEFHLRPALPIDLWSDREGVLAGRDLQGGGTWLGLHRSGRFGLITNFRDQLSPAQAPTRGQLIPDFLDGPHPPDGYLAQLATEAQRYAGFNLLLGDLQNLWYASNRHPDFATPLTAGVHALSNHLLNTPWPKLARLRDALSNWLALPSLTQADPTATSFADAEPVWQALNDRTPAPRHHLPDTGISLEWETLLSSPFIVHPEYGTRASTVILIGWDNSVRVEERSYGADGSLTRRQSWKTVVDQWPPEPNVALQL